jgi:1-hydroxycarotenoid 3,4-desaturase
MKSGGQSDQAPVVVIGAGVGGLASAITLAARGVETVVLERAGAPGGKMRQVEVDGALMDAGPTVFTMRWVFEELFDAAGSDLSRQVTLTPLHVLARHAWRAGERLDLHADRQQSVEAIGNFAGAAAARGYLDFCRRAERIYLSLERPFLRSSRPTPLSLAWRAGLRGLPALLRISPLRTMWHELGRHFADPRLRQLFGRYATYCGSSPFQAPATLMLVAHVEQSGVWTIQGGMHRLATAMADLAAARGARVRCGAAVEEILVRNGRTVGVRLAGGEQIAARAVVFNGDVAALGTGLLGESARFGQVRAGVSNRSLSAITWNLFTSATGFPLARHTVFFSEDSRREFDDLFARERLPCQPTVYVCAHDRGEKDDSREQHGRERLLCIVNAPARGDTRDAFTPGELDQCETETFRRLADCGLEVARGPKNAVRTTPTDFDRMFPATGGALYGRASHGWAASFLRPGARSRLPGLYLAGGSTHPGPGVPMAALSGRLAAESLLADLFPNRRTSPLSMHRSFPGATPGGTSMP